MIKNNLMYKATYNNKIIKEFTNFNDLLNENIKLNKKNAIYLFNKIIKYVNDTY